MQIFTFLFHYGNVKTSREHGHYDYLFAVRGNLHQSNLSIFFACKAFTLLCQNNWSIMTAKFAHIFLSSKFDFLPMYFGWTFSVCLVCFSRSVLVPVEKSTNGNLPLVGLTLNTWNFRGYNSIFYRGGNLTSLSTEPLFYLL